MERPLEVKNLNKRYGDFRAVKNASFFVEPNEVFALVGPNGAGKSTILKAVATILTFSGGEISIYSNSVKEKGDKIRKIISYLPEDAGAYKNMAGIGYLEFMAAILSDSKENQKKNVEFAAGISGLESRLFDKIKTYSKGMARKLLLARAVMARPKLAILDEPTSGLDVVNAVEIRKIIKNLAKEGMAVLLSSHNMLEIEFLSDRIAIMNAGEIKETGTAGELKRKYECGNLEEVFIKITGK